MHPRGEEPGGDRQHSPGRWYRLSFHNHLPVPSGRGALELSVEIGFRMVRRALATRVDVLSLNQWATVPGPFVFYSALVQRAQREGLEVSDRGWFLEVARGEDRLVLVRGLEVGVATAEGAVGEVLLSGVEDDFPVVLGELPGYTASRAQKSRLWRRVQEWKDQGRVWLVVAPHPCWGDGFGSAVTMELLRSGAIDTLEGHNSAVETYEPAGNRRARRLEEGWAARCGRIFRGVTGNDGVDPRAVAVSWVEVRLPEAESRAERLLAKLGERIRAGDVQAHRGRLGMHSLVWKFLNSGDRWRRLQSRVSAAKRGTAELEA